MPDLRKSSPSFAGLAEIPLQRSRLLLAAASLVHLAAALPALLLSLPFPIRGTWLLAVLASWLWRLLQDPVTAIRPLPDGRWRLILGECDVDAELRSWYVHPWCCVALFRAGWRFRRAVVVPRWCLDGETHRRLRVALRSSTLTGA